VLLSIHGGLGVVALAPLGPAFVSVGFMMGVFAAVVANPLSALFGDRGPALAGGASALALLVTPLLVTLMKTPAMQLADGQPDMPLIGVALGAAVALAGGLQWLLGRFRLSDVVRYVPYPVQAGFMLGVAVLMVIAVLPKALGSSQGQPPAEWPVMVSSLAVAGVSLALALRPPRWTRPVPGVLIALLGGTALHHGLSWALGPAAQGPVLGPLPLAWPAAVWWPRLAEPGVGAALLAVAGPMLLFAAALAVTATLQSLLAASAITSLTGVHHDSNSPVRAQGLANGINGLLGLLPVATAASYTLINQRAGARGTASRVVHAAVLLLILAVGVSAVRLLPMAVIAGIFIAVAWSLVEPWTRRVLAELARGLWRHRRPPPALTGPAVVLGLVALTSVGVSLVVGIVVGTLLSILQFVRSNMRPPVRHVTTADRLPSRKIRPPAATAWLREHGGRIAVVTLDGALFFGTADAAARAIEREAAQAQELILDFRRVSDIDVSGARVFLQAAASLQAAGKRLTLAGLSPAGPRGHHLREMDPTGLLPEDCFAADIDRALEQAEDRLLAARPAAVAEPPSLLLAQTMLCTGLDAPALSRLAASLRTLQVACGQVVFRKGDASDALYLLREGQVAISVPLAAGARRLVSFAPGVVFGEIGLLRGGRRTADAVAEADALLWVLDRAAYDQLLATEPALVDHLLRNISLHLADRLTALTLEVQALEDVTRGAV
jgi:sulfate permease, SulP family